MYAHYFVTVVNLLSRIANCPVFPVMSCVCNLCLVSRLWPFRVRKV